MNGKIKKERKKKEKTGKIRLKIRKGSRFCLL